MVYKLLCDINTFYVEDGLCKCERLKKGTELNVDKVKIIHGKVVCFYGDRQFTAETKDMKYAECITSGLKKRGKKHE